ncbi:CPBP family intramembrane glutamic endopeptidase [Alloiococcus sp. CFN-8]|uniref:CPBP family intramembrane glutamic endopeptidase n=1 Tax=Alloiococcus sp. CFN-8 TaxID=3416081 RepID=UPI003CF4C683
MKDLLKKPDMLMECSSDGHGHKFWIEVLIFIGVFLVLNIIQGIFGGIISSVYLLTTNDISALMAQGTNITEIIANSDVVTIVMLFTTIISIIGAIIYCRFIEKRPVRTMGFRKKNALKDYLLGLLIGAAIFSVSVLICILTDTADFVGLSTSFSAGIILLFFLGYLVQGMSEEVLCRGYFMISIARKNTLWAAVIANSVVFSMLHLTNPGIGLMPLINITLFGIFASVYMLKSGNIWGVAAIHSSWNFVQGNIFGIQVSGLGKQESIFSVTLTEGGSLINGGSFGLEGGLAVSIVLLISIFVVLYYKSSKDQVSNL